MEFRDEEDGRRELHIAIGFAAGSRFPCPEPGCGEAACPVHDATMSVAAGDAPMFPDDVKERFARTDFILDMYESGVYNREEAGEKLFDHLFGKGRAVMDSEG